MMAVFGEIDTDLTQLRSRNVLMTPPVWISQSLMALSLLPDTSNLPSGENAREVTLSVCPERVDLLVPVIASSIVMSPESSPTAMLSFRHTRAFGLWRKETSRVHFPHLSRRPLTTVTSRRDSEV